MVGAGDPQAKKVFKEEIALRLESGYPRVVLYLIIQGYLTYLDDDELDPVLESPKFLKNLPKSLLNKISDYLADKIRRNFANLT